MAKNYLIIMVINYSSLITKLFTSAFSLNLLPNDYTIPTYILTNGKVDSHLKCLLEIDNYNWGTQV